MDLKEIYQKSKGRLSHAERDLYFGYCAFADDNGFCFPKISTVADMLGILPQSASRSFKKLAKEKFLKKVSGGVLCLIGFNPSEAKTKPDVNFSKHSVKSETEETKHSVNKTKPDVNTTKHHVNSHIKEGTIQLTNHLRKNLNSNELSAISSKNGERKDERKDHPAIRMVHSLITRYPHKDLWERIIRDIGDNPDTEFFRESFEIWRGVNGNPLNLEKWLFEPNRTGKFPKIYGKEENGKSNFNHREQRAINEHQAIEKLRASNAKRREELRSGNAGSGK